MALGRASFGFPARWQKASPKSTQAKLPKRKLQKSKKNTQKSKIQNQKNVCKSSVNPAILGSRPRLSVCCGFLACFLILVFGCLGDGCVAILQLAFCYFEVTLLPVYFTLSCYFSGGVDCSCQEPPNAAYRLFIYIIYIQPLNRRKTQTRHNVLSATCFRMGLAVAAETNSTG